MNYRPEIDGLRAIAVLAVILYHANLFVFQTTLFPGGFLGVDIFFVISGYLISSIIFSGLINHNFSFLDFYERRARRILPALLIVMLVSIPFSWFLLLPKASAEYAGSLLSALSFGSNIWFLLEDAYTAEASMLKPFLHTWSLAVEEQFYIVFPALVVVFWKLIKQYIGAVFLVLIAASLYLAERESVVNPDAAFYLLHTRMWELLAGAILAFIEIRKGRSKHGDLASIMSFVGFLLIIIPVLVFNDQMQHPSLLTTIPVVGTMLIIWFCLPQGKITSVLSGKFFVLIGLISYSLYLWHFPIFAFMNSYYSFGAVEEKVLGIVLSLVAAFATWKFIEKPYRKTVSRKVFLSSILVASVTVISFCLITLASSGKLGRHVALEPIKDLWTLKKSDAVNLSSPVKIINIGDSHAGTIIGALRQYSLDNNVSFMSILASGTLPIKGLYYLSDGKFNKRYGPSTINFILQLIDDEIKAGLDNNQKVYLVMNGRFPLYLDGKPRHPVSHYEESGEDHFFTVDGKSVAKKESVKLLLEETIAHWSQQGASVVLVYPVPEMVHDIPRVAFQNGVIKGFLDKHDRSVDAQIPLGWYHDRIKNTSNVMESLNDKRLIKVYPEKILCNRESKSCSAFGESNLLYRDDNHLSDFGAMRLVDEIFMAITLHESMDNR